MLVPNEFKKQFARSKLLSGAESYKYELVRNLMTKRHCSTSGSPIRKAFRPMATAARRRLLDSNMIGVGFGAKESEKNLTGDLAVRVYVDKKVAEKNLSKKYIVPKTINGIATDVIELAGTPSLQQAKISSGASIGAGSNGGMGSLGCIVAKSNNPDCFILSASHVLAPFESSSKGDPVFHPADSENKIGELEEFVPLFGEGEVNEIDAALAKTLRKSDFSPVVPRIGKLNPQPIDAFVFQSVRKMGAASKHTLGIVIDIAADQAFAFVGQDRLLYSNLIVTMGCGTEFTQGGDSGSLIIDALTNRPVALHVGGERFRSWAAPIAKVLKKLNVTIST